jgi:hypothetical protein
VPVYDPRPENFIASRFDPSPVSGNPIVTQERPPPPFRPLVTEQEPRGPITIE